MKGILYTVCTALCLCLPVSAQTLGEITGIVTDSTGAVITGALVSAKNIGTAATREASTNESGIFSFPALNPGNYEVRVSLKGFKTAVRSDVNLEVQQNLRLDIQMSVGDIAESVSVSAGAISLQTENATVGTVIENKRIVELPLNGRNALSAGRARAQRQLRLPQSAGQAGSRQGGIRADQSISVGGQRAQYNRYTLDGVENTDPNFNTFVVLPSVDALQEFKVQSGIYPAEFGRGATQINILTKSGTNDYHGTLFYFLRNDKLDAKNYAFTAARPPKDPFKWNQFGFTLGGPVTIPKLFNGKNRLFFMANYEWFRQRRAVQAISSVPVCRHARRQLLRTAPRHAGIFDPDTRTTVNGQIVATPFPGNIIPVDRIHPISHQAARVPPAPQRARRRPPQQLPAGPGPSHQQRSVRPPLRLRRVSKSQWFGRYSWGDENQLTEALKLNGDKIVTNFNQYMVSNTPRPHPLHGQRGPLRLHAVLQHHRTGTRFHPRRRRRTRRSPASPAGRPCSGAFPTSPSRASTPASATTPKAPTRTTTPRMQFIDNMTIVRGKHTFKFGGEVRHDAYNQVGNQFARGQFTFQRNATNNLAQTGVSGDPFADFLLGETYQAEAAVSIANAKFRSTSFAFYVDDTWKISRKLTLNLGLRYEYNPPWEDQTGTLFNGIVPFDAKTTLAAPNVADQSLYPFFMRQGDARQNCYEGINLRWPDIATRCDGSLGNRLVGIDKNDFAPRIGISWSPSEKWVVRAGAGMFYSQDTGNPRFDMARNLAGRLRDNSNQQFPQLNWNNALASIAGGVANVPRPYTFANPYDRRTPYAMQMMLNVQRELAEQHRRRSRLPRQHQPPPRVASRGQRSASPPIPRVDSRAVFERSPFPNFGRIQLVDNGGNGNYNSLSGKLTKRYSSGLTYLVSYTWAKSIDTATAIRNQGGDTLFPQNSYCRSCERARSSHDVRQRFVTSALWDIPFGKGRKYNIDNAVLDAIAGGWQLGSILTLQTGFPITVDQRPGHLQHRRLLRPAQLHRRECRPPARLSRTRSASSTPARSPPTCLAPTATSAATPSIPPASSVGISRCSRTSACRPRGTPCSSVSRRSTSPTTPTGATPTPTSPPALSGVSLEPAPICATCSSL